MQRIDSSTPNVVPRHPSVAPDCTSPAAGKITSPPLAPEVSSRDLARLGVDLPKPHGPDAAKALEAPGTGPATMARLRRESKPELSSSATSGIEALNLSVSTDRGALAQQACSTLAFRSDAFFQRILYGASGTSAEAFERMLDLVGHGATGKGDVDVGAAVDALKEAGVIAFDHGALHVLVPYAEMDTSFAAIAARDLPVKTQQALSALKPIITNIAKSGGYYSAGHVRFGAGKADHYSTFPSHYQALWGECIARLALEKRFWQALKTTNAVERVHREIRRRTRSMDAVGEGNLTVVIAFIALRLEAGWRRQRVDSKVMNNLGSKRLRLVSSEEANGEAMEVLVACGQPGGHN